MAKVKLINTIPITTQATAKLIVAKHATINFEALSSMLPRNANKLLALKAKIQYKPSDNLKCRRVIIHRLVVKANLITK